jgi:hypothetical protein
MTKRKTSVKAMLDAWRAQQADRLDPLRFHVIEALEQRAAGHHGEVRRVLEQRLDELLAAYAGDLKRAGSLRTTVDRPAVSGRSALGELVDHLDARRAATPSAGAATASAAPAPAAFQARETVAELTALWSRLRTESQLRQSLQQMPANAGPLNSGALVHRSIALMRELSPGYLQQFVSYVDALSWLEQIGGGSVAAGRDAPRTSTRKRGRDKPRERHE